LAGLTFTLPLLATTAAGAVRATTSSVPEFAALPALTLIAFGFVPALCAALGAIAISMAQSGGVRIAAVTFTLGKLAPVPGFKRMFGGEAVVGALRAATAFAVVIAVVTPVVIRAVAAASASGSLAATAGIVQSAVLQACWSAVAAGALFAAADYALVRRRWLHSIKMTFDEVKRDAKEQDGDPHAKSRRRQLHRTLVRGGVARTREAAFVIANPTHIAIAIRYAPPEVPVPEIVCRARDALALEVRAIAERAGIPVVADVALARWLWRTGESGRPIPAETFVAVAITIAALVRAGALRA